jgi:RNA polymerase sigma-70 factor (ECF subfamily)
MFTSAPLLHSPSSQPTLAGTHHAFQDADEFSRLVSPAIPDMIRAARAIVDSDDLAWDAVQEVLLRVWRMGWLQPEPRAALRRLASLSALHLARCTRRRRFHEDRAATEEPCCSADPLAGLASAELRQSLRSALALVTASYRVVFELYELEDHDYGEISAALDLPIGTVRSRLHRARRELRARMGSAASLAEDVGREREEITEPASGERH